MRERERNASCERERRESDYLKDGGYVSCPIETHEVEWQLLKLVGPVVILLQMALQTETGEVGREVESGRRELESGGSRELTLTQRTV